MAFSPIQITLLLALLPAIAIASYVAPPKSHHQEGLKSITFTVYAQDKYQKTDFLIVNGVKGANLTSSTAPFGSIFVLKDSLTVTPNPKSKVVGSIEETTVTTSFDGLNVLSIAKVNLNVKGHKGSISILGGVNNLKPSTLPLVGGTEDFLFVQGYAVSTPISFKGLDAIIKFEFHFYWPPYASLIKY